VRNRSFLLGEEMTAMITGDYSKFPSSIRSILPYLAGETCELRQAWEVYANLFMKDHKRTHAMAERLGGVLGMLQSLLQDKMFLSIIRLTDGKRADLSLHSLLASIPDARDASFGTSVKGSLKKICAAATGIREHRHKRIAHFDLNVSLRQAILPSVTFKEIRGVLEQIEAFLNLFYREFGDTSIDFDLVEANDITDDAEVTTDKARAYDLLESEGVIPKLEWQRRREK